MTRIRLRWIVFGVLSFLGAIVFALLALVPERVSAAPAPLPPALMVARLNSATPPRKIKDEPPDYPEEAQRARVEGMVVLDIDIDAVGHVSGARIIRSVPMLDQAAMNAVMQWEYEPATLDGKPVPVTLAVTVRFSLKPDASQ